METNDGSREIRESLAATIKNFRAARGLSQEALALLADVDRSYVSHLERGIANPTLAILHKIATALGASVEVSLRLHD